MSTRYYHIDLRATVVNYYEIWIHNCSNIMFVTNVWLAIFLVNNIHVKLQEILSTRIPKCLNNCICSITFTMLVAACLRKLFANNIDFNVKTHLPRQFRSFVSTLIIITTLVSCRYIFLNYYYLTWALFRKAVVNSSYISKFQTIKIRFFN